MLHPAPRWRQLTVNYCAQLPILVFTSASTPSCLLCKKLRPTQEDCDLSCNVAWHKQHDLVHGQVDDALDKAQHLKGIGVI